LHIGTTTVVADGAALPAALTEGFSYAWWVGVLPHRRPLAPVRARGTPGAAGPDEPAAGVADALPVGSLH
jgi:hypothetical protein